MYQYEINIFFSVSNTVIISAQIFRFQHLKTKIFIEQLDFVIITSSTVITVAASQIYLLIHQKQIISMIGILDLIDMKLLQFKIHTQCKSYHKISLFFILNSYWIFANIWFLLTDNKLIDKFLEIVGVIYLQVIRYGFTILIGMAFYMVRERFVLLRKYLEKLQQDGDDLQNGNQKQVNEGK